MLYRKLQVSKHVIAFSLQDCGMLRLAIDTLRMDPPRVIRADEDRRPSEFIRMALARWTFMPLVLLCLIRLRLCL
eukprot:6466342-Amphidinium_carterae.2